MVRLGTTANKVTVIPNGVDVEKFHPVSQAEARKALNLPHGKMILGVGHLIHRKGFDRLIVAFKNACVEQRAESVHLCIIGEGPLRNELEGLSASLGLENRIHFVGNVAHHNLALWYSAADVFCLFTRQEGCPNVVLESLACGTPVVATPVGEIPYLIPNEEIGFLTDSDEQAMTRQLTRALKNLWSREAIRAYAKQYTWERVVQAVSGVFYAALGAAAKMDVCCSVNKGTLA
jgi:glycosyltransferase involved in cell wall biosynthesis